MWSGGLSVRSLCSWLDCFLKVIWWAVFLTRCMTLFRQVVLISPDTWNIQEKELRFSMGGWRCCFCKWHWGIWKSCACRLRQWLGMNDWTLRGNIPDPAFGKVHFIRKLLGRWRYSNPHMILEEWSDAWVMNFLPVANGLSWIAEPYLSHKFENVHCQYGYMAWRLGLLPFLENCSSIKETWLVALLLQTNWARWPSTSDLQFSVAGKA